MTGRRDISLFDGHYRAHKDAWNQQGTINDIWKGVYGGNIGWNHHNFTIENVTNGSMELNSDYISVGDNKKYYIDFHGWVCGYIYISGTFNGGTWLTVNVSAAAGGHQLSAIGGLVANPAGNMLIYIGKDTRSGEVKIGCFTIHDVWTYSYFELVQDPAIIPYSSLIFPKNNVIYYIGKNRYNGEAQVHGFYYDETLLVWRTLSPTYSVYGAGGTIAHYPDVSTKICALTYEHRFPADFDRLYYRNSDGYLSYFKVNGLFAYTYHFVYIGFHIQVIGNVFTFYRGHSLVYFIARDTWAAAGHSNWVYIIEERTDGLWDIISPSYFAGTVANQAQSATGILAVSPDGSRIAYFGGYTNPDIVNDIVVLKTNDGIHFVYERVFLSDGLRTGNNSLQFFTNNDLYYASWYNGCVHHLVVEEDYCNNPLRVVPTE